MDEEDKKSKVECFEICSSLPRQPVSTSYTQSAVRIIICLVDMTGVVGKGSIHIRNKQNHRFPNHPWSFSPRTVCCGRKTLTTWRKNQSPPTFVPIQLATRSILPRTRSRAPGRLHLACSGWTVTVWIRQRYYCCCHDRKKKKKWGSMESESDERIEWPGQKRVAASQIAPKGCNIEQPSKTSS